MPKEKSKMSFTVRLHKNVDEYSDVIKQELLNDDMQQIGVNTNYGEGEIFVPESKKREPDWKHTLNSISDGDIEIQDNVSSSAVLVFKVSEKFMSISFGYGSSLLDKDKIVTDFGTVVTGKELNESNLLSMDSIEISDTTTKSNKALIGVASNSGHVFLKSQSEFARGAKGLRKHGAIETMLEGKGETLVFSRKMKLEDIISDLKSFLDIYNDTHKKMKEWASRFTEITNSSERKTLDKKLSESLLSEQVSEQEFAICWPDDTDIESYEFEGFKADPDIEPLQLASIYQNSLNQNWNDKQVLSALKRHKLKITLQDGSKQRRSIYKCLIMEVTYNQSKYILMYGIWYKADKDFYQEIHEKFQKIINNSVTSFLFPKWPEKTKEDEYNDDLTTSINSNGVKAEQIHKNLAKKKQYNTTGIEIADILTENNEFVHVKNGHSSSVLSHLFFQGDNSAKLIASDPGIVADINREIKTFQYKETQNSNITIVYGIRRKKHNLPFFSMISCVETEQSLREKGFKVAVKYIDIV